MPKPSQAKSRSQKDALEVSSSSREGRGRKISKTTEVVAVTTALAPTDAHIQEALEEFRAGSEGKSKKAESAYTAKLKAAGKPIYTASEVSKLFGIAVPEDYTQQELQGLVEYGHVLFPLRALAKTAKGVMEQYVVPGRLAIRKLVAGAYKAYLMAETSEHSREIFRALRAALKSKGITAHKDAPNSSVLVRMVFSDLTPKRVHLYSRALEYAAQWGIEPNKFDQFISDEGGFEKVRTSASKVNPEKILQREDKQLAADLTTKWLEVEEGNPFLTVTMLTRDQRARLNCGDWREVILVARVEHDVLKVYARVPLTPDVQKSVRAALYKEAGQDPEVIRKHIERRERDARDRTGKDPDPLYGYMPRASEEGLATMTTGHGE